MCDQAGEIPAVDCAVLRLTSRATRTTFRAGEDDEVPSIIELDTAKIALELLQTVVGFGWGVERAAFAQEALACVAASGSRGCCCLISGRGCWTVACGVDGGKCSCGCCA